LDDQAGYYQQLWKDNTLDEVVKITLANEILWGTDLNAIPGFAAAVEQYLESLIQRGAMETLKDAELSRDKVASHEA
jgi:tagaturonate reductase